MSHHFDTPTAKEDPRINICDFYFFRGRPGTTVMALTVNPNAGVVAPDTFRDEGLYAFRFDTNRDLREDVTFKVQFGAPAHADSGRPGKSITHHAPQAAQPHPAPRRQADPPGGQACPPDGLRQGLLLRPHRARLRGGAGRFLQAGIQEAQDSQAGAADHERLPGAVSAGERRPALLRRPARSGSSRSTARRRSGPIFDYIDQMLAADGYLPPPPELADYVFTYYAWTITPKDKDKGQRTQDDSLPSTPSLSTDGILVPDARRHRPAGPAARAWPACPTASHRCGR